MRRLSIADLLWVFLLSASPLQSAEPKITKPLTLQARFRTFSDGFLDKIGLEDGKDPKHGFYVLSEIESFFLISDRAAAKKIPAPMPIASGAKIRVAKDTEPQ